MELLLGSGEPTRSHGVASDQRKPGLPLAKRYQTPGDLVTGNGTPCCRLQDEMDADTCGGV